VPGVRQKTIFPYGGLVVPPVSVRVGNATHCVHQTSPDDIYLLLTSETIDAIVPWNND